MPFIVQAVIHPAPGRADSVVPLLEERVKQMHARGHRANLAMTLFGGARDLFMNQLMADLAEADAYLASPDSQLDPAWLAKVAPLLAERTSFNLGELVLPMPAGSGRGPAFNYQATLYPKPGAGRRLIELAVEVARYDQANGARALVGRLVAGEGEGLIFASNAFDSLANIEQFRNKSQDDAERLKIMEQAGPLMARPARFEIRRILIPIQPA